MREQRNFGICIALVVAGCTATTTTYIPGVPTTLTPAQKQAVHDGIRQRLKDPDSARFTGLEARQLPSGSVSVCGFVNARNSFGGYAGNTPFFGVLGGDYFAVGTMGGTNLETIHTMNVCRREGMFG
jgi:hypothetical protein